jgi:hypothetical protein
MNAITTLHLGSSCWSRALYEAKKGDDETVVELEAACDNVNKKASKYGENLIQKWNSLYLRQLKFLKKIGSKCKSYLCKISIEIRIKKDSV